jgi:hypothetical protein
MGLTIAKDILKRREVVRLRKKGVTYAKIGKTLGSSRMRAWQLFSKEMKGTLGSNTPRHQEIRPIPNYPDSNPDH